MGGGVGPSSIYEVWGVGVGLRPFPFRFELKGYLLELVLALLVFVVIAWRVTRLHTLGVLGSIWQGEQLLLQLCRDVDTSEVGAVSPHTDFVATGVTEENALLRRMVLLWMNAGKPAGIAAGSVDGEGAVDVTPSLVELDGLPGILCSLTDSGSVDDGTVTRLCVLLLVTRLHLLALDVSLYLILSETQGQIQLEGLIILPRLRFLKACLVRVRRRPRATLSSAAWVLRAMII